MFDRYLAGGNLPALEDDQARLSALAANVSLLAAAEAGEA